MAFYRNPNCPYCGEAFTASDDIVTCPECGTAHHRACWQAHGDCAMINHHGQPDFVPPAAVAGPAAAPKAEPAAEEPPCPRCGYRNRPDVRFCSGCGMPFGAEAHDARPTIGFDPAQFDPSINFSANSDFEDVPSIDMTRLVDSNTLYYLPVFSRLRAGRRGGLNIAALLFGGSWFLYRKQYARGIFVLIVQFLLRALELFCYYTLYNPIFTQVMNAAGIPLNTTVLTNEQNALLMAQLEKLSSTQLLSLVTPTLVGLISFIFLLVIAFKANNWYYHDLLDKARRIRSQHGADSDATLVEESRQGGVSLPLGAGVFVGFNLVMTIADFILMYLSTPK